MGINLELYRKAVTSKDRVFTGKCDVNGRKINVGDVIVPIGSTEQYCVNYSPTGRCFYGLGVGNKISLHMHIQVLHRVNLHKSMNPDHTF